MVSGRSERQDKEKQGDNEGFQYRLSTEQSGGIGEWGLFFLPEAAPEEQKCGQIDPAVHEQKEEADTDRDVESNCFQAIDRAPVQPPREPCDGVEQKVSGKK